MEEALSSYRYWKQLVEDDPCDVDKCNEMLQKLKIQMTQFSFLNPSETQKSLFFSREILEYAVILSIKAKDIEAFERNMKQLKTYYHDVRSQLPESEKMYSILGLNLLRLLAQNRLAEFHIELELIPIDKHQSNLFIKYPVQLEQFLMEGSYNAIFNGDSNLPAENYRYFLSLLLETVQDRIADCCESAYHSLSLQDAQKILRFSNQSELADYAKQRAWEIRDGFMYFKEDEKKKIEVPAKPLIQRTLNYAKELERIV